MSRAFYYSIIKITYKNFRKKNFEDKFVIKYTIMISTTLLLSMPAGAYEKTQFPVEYQSSWADSIEECKIGHFFTISTDKILYNEGSENLVRIVSDALPTKTNPARSILVEVTYEYAGDIHPISRFRYTIINDILFRLDGDTIVGLPGERLVRCPVDTATKRYNLH